MDNFLELIPSKTMKKYLKEIGHEFTDRERATIIYNLWLPLSKRDELLLDIAWTTADAELRDQIEDRIDFDKEQLKKIEEETEGFVFFIEGVFCAFDEEYGAVEYGGFTNLALARQVAMQAGKEFKIQKERVFSAPVSLKESLLTSTVGGIYYNEQGEVMSYWTDASDEMFRLKKRGEAFEERYVEIPHPFVFGCRVHIVGDSELYNIRGYLTAEEEAAFLERTGSETLQECLDYMDAALVLVRTEDAEENHTHYHPFYLELAL